MRPSKVRFVTACQQLLALATVIAVMAPATDVVSLDVVITRPGSSPTIAERPALERADPAKPAPKEPMRTARVETEPVDPEVVEVPMQEKPKARDRAADSDSRPAEEPADEPAETDDGAAGEELVSEPEPVNGFGAVGVTWSDENEIADDEIVVSVRTRTGDTWSQWQEIEYHDEHQPDPGSDEARNTRPGTDPLIIGDVDQVQARAVTEDGAEPVDMKLAVIAPGRGEDRVVEPGDIELPPAGNTGGASGDGEIQLQSAEGATAEEEPATEGEVPADEPVTEEPATEEEGLDLESATAPRPTIYSRKQWGANESLRSGSPRYGTIRAGFVHHTVNSNSYSSGQVPAIIRSIYAYHTQSRGWSDIGYNFLVDRFGRIWEGRFGGVTRPVIGAHTLGYNQYSFAMSAIGNFETVQPTSAMLRAYGRLMGWKLSLHGINALDDSQKLGSRYFKAINGHRDAGSTACPGRYLYAKLPTIRTLARRHQTANTAPKPAPEPVDRKRLTDLASTRHPDLLLRRPSDGLAFVVPTRGLFSLAPPVKSNGFGNYDTVVASPDLTGDGRPDIVVRHADTSVAGVRPGDGTGRFGAMIRPGHPFRGAMDAVTATGDLDGDGRNDLVARATRSGRLYFFKGNGNGTFQRIARNTGWNRYSMFAATGDVTSDGRRDLITRDREGGLWIHPGRGNGTFAPRRFVGKGWGGMNGIAGGGDWNADGRPDLFVRHGRTGYAYIAPGHGKGRFGRLLGPFRGARDLKFFSSGGNIIGSKDPDLVGVRHGGLAVTPHRGTHNTGAWINTGRHLGNFSAVLNAGDWNADGKGDMVTRANTSGNLHLWTGRGNGRFNTPVQIAYRMGEVGLLTAVGDLTGDGKPDIVGQPAGSSLRFYAGNGGQVIASSGGTGVTIDKGARPLGIGMWDADKVPDVMFSFGSSATWYAGNGSGGLRGGSPVGLRLGSYEQVVAPGDVDGDNRPDVVALDKDTGRLWLYRATSSGFRSRFLLAENLQGYQLVG